MTVFTKIQFYLLQNLHYNGIITKKIIQSVCVFVRQGAFCGLLYNVFAMKKRLFSIPDANSRDNGSGEYNIRLINRAFLACMQKHPEWFFDDFQIETAYGCPGSCIWNGNRSMGTIDEFDEGWADAVLGMYAHYGIKYRVTFTNFLLKPEHLRDKMGNAVAVAISKFGGGYVMVSTNLMANYMKRYPKLNLNWSTTTDFGKDVPSQIKKINELSAKNLVVVPYEFNNRPELQQFEHPENLEVFVNEPCIDNCPYRREHWRAVNEVILSRKEITQVEVAKMSCRFPEHYVNEKPLKHTILREQLGDYDALGIRHFKVSGRLHPDVVMETYLEHFVRRGKEEQVRDYVSYTL